MIYDKDIREPLFEFLEEKYGKIRILEEKNMGRSRADVVMVTETELMGIEIKSDADRYARLARQVTDYDRYYDKNIVVVGTKHALHIREHVPVYWGVITVELLENQLDFYVLREPEDNPKATWDKKLSVLWRPELAHLQEYFQMPKYKEKSKSFVIEKIINRIPEKISEEILRREISEILFQRDYTKVLETLREYRKSETRKKLESEENPYKRLEIMVESASRGNFGGRRPKKRVRRQR